MEKRIFYMKVNNMVKWILPFYLFTFLPLSAQVGTWRNYLSYHDVQEIQAAGDDIFVLASNDLYQYNKADQSIVTYDKVNGLSDTYITHIRWCQQGKRLIAAYSNSNIDLIETNGSVTNISDLYTKAIAGEKTINSITINGQYAYLSCGFGIVKLNVKNAEVSESYMLNRNVTGVVIKDGYIYARLTETYQYSDPADFIIPFHGTISIPDSWNDNKAHTLAYVVKASVNDNLIDIKNWSVTTSFPSFTQDNSDYDNYYDTVSKLLPGGPKNNYAGFLRFVNNKLYTCNGITSGNFAPGFPGTIQNYDGNEWEFYQDVLDSITGHTYRDLATVDADPLDPTHVFAGGRIGLYEFRNGRLVKEYNYDNSDLQSNATLDHLSKNYTQVEGLLYDNNGHLWLLNSASKTSSVFELTKEGQWINHHKPELLNSAGRSYDNMVNPMFDSRGILWFCNDRFVEPALLCYNPATDKAYAYTSFVNQDGTTMNFTGNAGIRSVAEDLDGNIWIATSSGTLMLEPSEFESSSPVFTQPKIPRNDGTNYADYLLAGLDISAIAVDGAGRKWFGTLGNGVYLISADNMEQIEHFTEDNSPLISNNILSIAINHSTGEVFFGSENGLCSYVSDATESNTEMTKDNVWAYPNPVTPDYTGLITITGLTYNADVKIISSNGALIAEGRSNGGMFNWDGKDRQGRRVASGVYMAVTTTSTGEKGTVCKIAIIN